MADGSTPSSNDEAATKQALFDRCLRVAAIRLRGFELAVGDEASDVCRARLVRRQPGSLGPGVVLGYVDDGNVVKAGLGNEFGVGPSRGDLPRPGPNGSTVSLRIEVGGDVDGGERETTARSE